MWTRKELKTKGKEAMKRNYWKSVLAAMLLTLIAAGSSASSFSNGFSNGYNSKVDQYTHGDGIDIDLDVDEDSFLMENPGDIDVTQGAYGKNDDVDPEFSVGLGKGLMLAIFVTSFIVLFLVLFAIGTVIDVFIVNPVELGVKRFFLRNQQKNADMKEVMFAFDHSYKNTVKILFIRDAFIFLWSLLFIIPGIVKAYEYRMIPFLLAEDPSMDKDLAFATSKEMMQGQKWRTFVLDLSFIWWDLLGIITCGIVSYFYVAPYKYNTKAALYEALKSQITAAIEE